MKDITYLKYITYHERYNISEIEKKEYFWMHRLNTFQPVEMNIEYLFGIPFLGQNWRKKQGSTATKKEYIYDVS